MKRRSIKREAVRPTAASMGGKSGKRSKSQMQVRCCLCACVNSAPLNWACAQVHRACASPGRTKKPRLQKAAGAAGAAGPVRLASNFIGMPASMVHNIRSYRYNLRRVCTRHVLYCYRNWHPKPSGYHRCSCACYARCVCVASV